MLAVFSYTFLSDFKEHLRQTAHSRSMFDEYEGRNVCVCFCFDSLFSYRWHFGLSRYVTYETTFWLCAIFPKTGIPQLFRPDKVNPCLLLPRNGNGALRFLVAVDGLYDISPRRQLGIQQRPGVIDGQRLLVVLAGNDNRCLSGQLADFVGV